MNIKTLACAGLVAGLVAGAAHAGGTEGGSPGGYLPPTGSKAPRGHIDEPVGRLPSGDDTRRDDPIGRLPERDSRVDDQPGQTSPQRGHFGAEAFSYRYPTPCGGCASGRPLPYRLPQGPGWNRR